MYIFALKENSDDHDPSFFDFLVNSRLQSFTDLWYKTLKYEFVNKKTERYQIQLITLESKEMCWRRILKIFAYFSEKQKMQIIGKNNNTRTVQAEFFKFASLLFD